MKNILILEPSTSGLELLSTAHKMGLRTFVLTADRDERIIPAEYKKYIFKSIKVDTNDLSELSNAALRLHRDYNISAVIPGFEIFVAHASYLAKLLNVPGVSPETGQALRNKKLMRECLETSGVRIPRYAVIDSPNKLNEIDKNIGFPCVIKPIDQSGSMHVSKITHFEELAKAYHNMCQDPWTEMGKGIGTIALVEEYVDGEEFSVEGFVCQNHVEIISITKKFLGPEPYFVEMAHIVQADVCCETKNNISSYIKEVITALKFNVGVYHCEIRLNNEKPILMEIAGRLPGDKICDLIQLAKQINIYEIMINILLGNSISLKNEGNSNQFAGIKFFAPVIQCYQKIETLEQLHSIPGYHDFKILIPQNTPIPPCTSFLGRVAYCIFTSSTYEDLKSLFIHSEKIVRFV